MQLRFGEFTFNPKARLLTRRGAPIHLTRKALELLELLLSDRPRAFSKEELLTRLWSDAFVAEGSLANLVSEVRKAFGGKSGYIRTLHGFGYAFRGPVQEISDPPSTRKTTTLPAGELNILRDDSVDYAVPLAEGETLIGRGPESQVRLIPPSVSRRHACITIHRDRVTIEDLGSKHGTYVGDERIVGPTNLKHGDHIRVASVEMILRLREPVEETV
jgi:DNA-binding winged helix-turn-helix (wHTH) protein